jgi:hypothetical protein
MHGAPQDNPPPPSPQSRTHRTLDSMADLHGLQRAISTHYGNARAGAEARAAAERLLDWWSLDDGALEDVADALAGAAVASRTHPVLRARVFEWAWAHARFVVANDGGGGPAGAQCAPCRPGPAAPP